jgi:hypothetical protein
MHLLFHLMIFGSLALDLQSHDWLFSSYKLCSSREKVRIANGSLSSVSGKGSISISPSMSLSSVLHIIDFAANLLFIARITRELNCRAIFYSNYCLLPVYFGMPYAFNKFTYLSNLKKKLLFFPGSSYGEDNR